jgi:hypothetical protein
MNHNDGASRLFPSRGAIGQAAEMFAGRGAMETPIRDLAPVQSRNEGTLNESVLDILS